MTTPKLIPLGDRILVEPVESAADPQARIVIPANVKEPPSEGIVRALGTGRRKRDGKFRPYEVQAGDRVVFLSHGGTVIKSEPNDYRLLERNEILAVFS